MIIGQKNIDGNESMVSGKPEGILVGYCILDALPSKVKMTKTASAGNVDAILTAVKAFASVLESLSATSNISNESISELSKTAGANSESVSKETTIKLPSTEVKDSHYFMDVSLDPIKKADKSLIMASFFMREGYLGKYMIKRCFYYLPSNTKEANETYHELVRKSEGVKKRYLQGEIKPFDIMPQIKSVLDGIHGDFEFKDEDCLGTTVKRDREGYHTAEGPMHPHLASEDHIKPVRM